MVTARDLHPAFGPEMTTVTDPEEIGRLMASASGEAATLVASDQSVSRLHEAQRAKLTLSRLDTTTLRYALNARRRALGGDVE